MVEILKEAWDEKGCNGEGLGKEIRISKVRVSQMENGEVNFKISDLIKIA